MIQFLFCIKNWIDYLRPISLDDGKSENDFCWIGCWKWTKKFCANAFYQNKLLTKTKIKIVWMWIRKHCNKFISIFRCFNLKSISRKQWKCVLDAFQTIRMIYNSIDSRIWFQSKVVIFRRPYLYYLSILRLFRYHQC